MREALLIIDMQKVFVPAYAETLADDIKAFTKYFNNVGVTQYINTPYTSCATQLLWKDSMQGTEDTELLPPIKEVLKDEGTVLFTKHTYSAVNDALLQWLQSNRIERVYLCGVSTTCCVLATAYALFDKGYNTFVIPDLCASSTEERHIAALQVMQSNIPLMTVKEFKRYL